MICNVWNILSYCLDFFKAFDYQVNNVKNKLFYFFTSSFADFSSDNFTILNHFLPFRTKSFGRNCDLPSVGTILCQDVTEVFTSSFMGAGDR